MKIHDCAQGTLEWLALRCGIVTASEADALISPLGKIRTGDGVQTYLCQKVAERWIQAPIETFDSWAMEAGKILEERARPWLALELDKHGLEIGQVGFITDDAETIGCSPDGLIYDEENCVAGVEIKCPMAKTHVSYLINGGLPKAYVAQVQASLFVTKLPEWKFVSYHVAFPKLVLSIKPDPDFHEQLEDALLCFNNSLHDAFEMVCAANGGPPPKREPMVFSNQFVPDMDDVLQ